MLEISAPVLRKYSPGMLWYLRSLKGCLGSARRQRPELAFFSLALEGSLGACIFSDTWYDVNYVDNLAFRSLLFVCFKIGFQVKVEVCYHQLILLFLIIF